MKNTYDIYCIFKFWRCSDMCSHVYVCVFFTLHNTQEVTLIYTATKSQHINFAYSA